MKTLAAVICISGMFSSMAMAGSQSLLEDLERERAAMVDTVISADLSVDQRGTQIDLSLRRLADIERMVLRDDSISSENTAVVRRAFSNYDLTFLVHASAETKTHITDHWLEQVGLSTDSLLATTQGRR